MPRSPATFLFALTVLAVAACSAPARRVYDLPGRTDSRPYHHVVVAGDTVWVAGTIGLDPASGRPPADAREEARLVLDDVRKKLALVGLTMDDLVSVQVFCPDLSLYDAFNEVYATFFAHTFPARAFVGSGPLLFGGRFEVCAVAAMR